MSNDTFRRYGKKESMSELVKEEEFTIKLPVFVKNQILEEYDSVEGYLKEKILDDFQTSFPSVNYKLFNKEIENILNNKILLDFNIDNDINNILKLVSFDKQGLELFLDQVRGYDDNLISFFSDEDNLSSIRPVVRLYCRELLSNSNHPMKDSLINIIDTM